MLSKVVMVGILVLFLISEGRFHEFIMIKYNVLRGFFLFCFVFSSQISLSCQTVPFLFLAKLWKVGPDNPVHSYPIWKLLVLLSLDCRKGRWTGRNQSGRPQSARQAGAGSAPWTREHGTTCEEAFSTIYVLVPTKSSGLTAGKASSRTSV